MAPWDARREAADDLVVDRPKPVGEVLRRLCLLAVATDDRRRVPRAHARGPTEVYRDVVHADGPHERVAPTADEHVAVVGESAPQPVAISDRKGGEPRVIPGDEAEPE